MPLVDITNPDVIKFLIENYDKTALLRMKWNRIHSNKLKKAATLNREPKGYFESDVLENVMIGGMATITRDHEVAGYNRRRKPIRDVKEIPGISFIKKGNSIVDVGLGDPAEDPRLKRSDTDLSADPIMRPVPPEQKAIIYKDIPNFGRKIYLSKRSKIAPEAKYYFNECSGWVYGWRLEDSFFRRNPHRCGRVWRLTRDVKSRTGPHPDPDHYKDSDPPGPTKCLN